MITTLQDYIDANSNDTLCIKDSLIRLYSQLSVCEIVSDIIFDDILNSNNLFVYIDRTENKIVGVFTMIIEQKMIHNGGKVCHVEDVVVDKNYRNCGIGAKLIDYCKEYSKLNGCYKIILNCDELNKPFYLKSGFKCKNVEMSYYFE